MTRCYAVSAAPTSTLYTHGDDENAVDYWLTEAAAQEQFVLVRACMDVRFYLTKYVKLIDIHRYEVRVGGNGNTRALIYRDGVEVSGSRSQ